MDWKDIPSLSALRAFEAAARLGSYSAAARDLNVTHAAIAQHVRRLEVHFGHELMRRDPPGMAATAHGAALATSLSAGFSEIAAGVRALTRVTEDGPISLTTTVTLAENWLMPRLGWFWRERPDIPVTISADNAVRDLRRDGFDVAIRYGRGDWPGQRSELLLKSQTVIVAHPDLAAKLPKDYRPDHPKAAEMLSVQDWAIDIGSGEFQIFLKERGIAPDRLCRTDLDANNLVLAACRAGIGLSAQSRAVVEADIAEGRLVCLLEEDEKSAAGYFIVTNDTIQSDRVKTFVRWLRSQA